MKRCEGTEPDFHGPIPPRQCFLLDGHDGPHVFEVSVRSGGGYRKVYSPVDPKTYVKVAGESRCTAGNGRLDRCYLQDGHAGDHVFTMPVWPLPATPDPVNKAPHYNQGKVEAIDAIEAAVTGLEGAEAFLTGQCLKYLWRWKQKGGAEDLAKCAWYLERLRTRQAAAKAVTP